LLHTLRGNSDGGFSPYHYHIVEPTQERRGEGERSITNCTGKKGKRGEEEEEEEKKRVFSLSGERKGRWRIEK